MIKLPLTIEGHMLWIFARTWRMFLAFIPPFLVALLVIGFCGVTDERQIGYGLLIAFVPFVLFGVQYRELAVKADKYREKLTSIENLLRKKHLESPALSGIYELCVNSHSEENDYEYAELFTDEILARHFHKRLLVIFERMKEGDQIQYKGVRSLDYAFALRCVIEQVGKLVNNENSFHYLVSFYNQVIIIRNHFVSTFVKPQEEFFVQASKTDSYEEYFNSILYRYDQEVLTQDERMAKIDMYFIHMTKDQIVEFFAHVINLDNPILSSDITEYLKKKYIESKTVKPEEQVAPVSA